MVQLTWKHFDSFFAKLSMHLLYNLEIPLWYLSKYWREIKTCPQEKGTLLHCWWEYKLIQPLWRAVWRFLKKLQIELPYDPAIPLLGIYPEKTIIQKDACTTMFIAALFTISRTWKQPKCPLTDEWIKKMWYIYIQWNITQP